MKRKVFGLLVALLFCCALPLSGASGETAPAESGAPCVVRVYAGGSEWNALLRLPAGVYPTLQDALAQNSLSLPTRVTCDFSDGSSRYVGLRWPEPDGLDLTQSGRVLLTAEYILPEGFALGEGLPLLQKYLFVYADGMAPEPLASVTSANFPPFLIAQGSDPAMLEASATALMLPAETVFSETLMLPIIWDFSSVDLTCPGQYRATALMHMPSGFSLPDGFSPPEAMVAVLNSEFIDLSGAFLTPRNTILCQWFYTIKDPENIQVEFALGDAPWEILSEYAPFWGGYQFKYGVFSGNELEIFTGSLPLDADCHFRLTYGGRTSNVLTTRYSADGGVFVSNVGGDRDGGDRTDQPLPDITQPAPLPVSFPSPSPEPSVAPQPTQMPVRTPEATPAPTMPEAIPSPTVIERITQTTTVVSGARLSEMLAANPDTVLFEKRGISVELPSSFLSGLNLADRETLTVRIERNGYGFSLDILQGETALSSLPATRVSVPAAMLPSGEGTMLCAAADGGSICAVAYDESLKIASFFIQNTGSFTLYCDTPSPAPAEEVPLAALTPAAPASAQSAQTNGLRNVVLILIGCLTAFAFAAFILKVIKSRRTPR